MNEKYIFSILIGLISVISATLVFLSQQVQRIFKSEVQRGIKRTEANHNQILTKNDIENLPELIQKYLVYTGVLGKEKVKSLHTISEIDMNLGQGSGWTKMIAEEYNFFDQNPARMVLMNFKMKGLPVIGMDSYIDGRGQMLMKPFGLITVLDAKGHEMDDTSAKVMLLLNMCTAAPSTLIDERIKWIPISPTSVKATFDDNGCAVSAVLEFNATGELINFGTEDKYYFSPEGDYVKVKWSTPVRNYKYINGLNLSTYGEAIWHFPKGDNRYGKLTLKQISHNGDMLNNIE